MRLYFFHLPFIMAVSKQLEQNYIMIIMPWLFQTFLGQKYGYRPFPPKIVAIEFKKLLSVVKSDIEKMLLIDWFKEDKNSIPNVYALQPITTRLPNFTNNHDPGKKKEVRSKIRVPDRSEWQS
jgi:hypothetical protein